MMRKKIILLISTFVLVSTVIVNGAVIKGTADLKISGDIKLDIPNANVYMNYMKRIRIWHISINTPSKDYKKDGKKGSAHLFFSRKFNLKTGTFPISFSYLNKKDTMGGSFSYREKPKRSTMFSHDTNGKITFTKIGDLIEGTFSFTVYSNKDQSQSVKITGKFSVPRKNGFPGVPLTKK